MRTFTLLLLLAGLTPFQGYALQPGKIIGRHIHGLAHDVSGNPMRIQGKTYIHPQPAHEYSLSVDKTPFTVSIFEDDISSVYVTTLQTADKKPYDTNVIDLSAIGGVSKAGAGTETLWNSILFNEQIAVDAKSPQTFTQSFEAYYAGQTDQLQPYDYGWLSEVIVINATGESKVIKHYAVGRVHASSIALMPDGKTLYLLDANHSGQLYVFIAEEPNSFSQGALYLVGKKAGKTVYSKLGDTSALKMKFKLRKMEFDDLFKSADPSSCKPAYKKISFNGNSECLQLQKKNSKYAGLFEPERYIAYQQLPGIQQRFSDIRYKSNKTLSLFSKQQTHDLSLGSHSSLPSDYLIQELP